MLVQEFQDVIKHYSNTATISFLIKHLTDKFETTETESSPILFIPIETVSKLEQICWWYELNLLFLLKIRIHQPHD